MAHRKNDIGGDRAGAVPTEAVAVKHWEQESDALRKVMGAHVSLDELRRAMEDLPQETYDAGFFARRIEAMAVLLVEKGVLTRGEIEARKADLATAGPAATGDGA
ncbi:MAG: nitrile hydratase [Pseudomonadota bacterium]